MQKSTTDTDDRAARPAESSSEDLDRAPGAAGAEAGGEVRAEDEVRPEDMSRDQLIEQLQAAREEASGSHEAYLRVAAELENIKKRHLRDREEMRKFSNETLIKNLLTVIDNLEQALVHADGGGETIACVTEGVQLTLKGFIDILSKEGLVQVTSIGAPFDPNFHEAVSEIEDRSAEPGTIVHELQRGYLLNGRLIRPAKVVVSRKPS